jgi:Ca2+-binding RTX toxin-like protein
LASGGVTIRNSGTMEGTIIFGGGNDTYDGRGGTIDSLVHGFGGNDRLIGGAGTEQLVGGIGHDVLTGGGGADDFIYNNTGDSTVQASGRDLITDFSHRQHDKIDLRAVDASSAGGGNEAFHFIGRDAFDGTAGELRYSFKSGHTFVLADTDGDRQADFEIALSHHVALAKGDFLL